MAIGAAGESAGQGTSRQGRSRSMGRYDWALLFTVTAMLGLGVVMVFSASYPRAGGL